MPKTKIRRQLQSLSRDCEAACEDEEWTRSYRLIYSSVESYEKGNGVAILGLNPAGGSEAARNDDPVRPFREPGYTAYLDDSWGTNPVGQAGLQRAVQAIAMVLTGSSPCEAIAAVQNSNLRPAERIGFQAERLLRNAPSGNIIPFRGSKLSEMPISLRDAGKRIGWELLCIARPKPRLIVTLANGLTAPPWKTILTNCKQPKPWNGDHCKIVHEPRNYYYRDLEIREGYLKGTLLIGLPAVISSHSKGFNEAYARPMLEVLSSRRRIYEDRLA